MAEPKNLPIDYRWKPELGVRDKSHELKNGEYVDVQYEHQEFPKFKYHADYVHQKEEGVGYPFTANAQVVNNAKEEAELGEEWKDFPGEHRIVTAPDAEEVASRQRKSAAAGANWRAAASLPAVAISEHHVAFLRAQGMNTSSLGEAYAFLATLTSAQMKSLLDEAAGWSESQEGDLNPLGGRSGLSGRGGPGGGPGEARTVGGKRAREASEDKKV